MLDTIRLYSQDFTIKDGARITLQPGQQDYSSGEVREAVLFRKENGEAQAGASVFIADDDNYHFQVQVKGGQSLAFIQCSLPKIAHDGDNYYPATAQECGKALDQVEENLKERGVMVNVKACKLSRTDLFKNACTSEPFENYRPIYELLHAKRQIKRDYGTSFLFSNTRRELCVYSKLAEMQARGVSTKGMPDTTRFELRFKTAAVNKEMFGFSTAGELVNNLDHAEEVYKCELVKNLFRLVPGDVEVLAASQLEREMIFFKENSGTHWMAAYEKALGAHAVLSYGEEAIKRSLESVGSNRMQAWRLLNQVRRDHAKLELLRSEEGEVKTMAQLYEELKQLVVGA